MSEALLIDDDLAPGEYAQALERATREAPPKRVIGLHPLPWRAILAQALERAPADDDRRGRLEDLFRGAAAAPADFVFYVQVSHVRAALDAALRPPAAPAPAPFPPSEPL